MKFIMPLLLVDDYTTALTKEPFKMLAIHLTDKSRLTAFCDSIADWAEDSQYIFSNENIWNCS